MSDTKTVGNPFLDENFASGGGLWDGKTITILSARTMVDWIKRGDGTSFLDEDGNPAYRNVLEITGVADEEEMERRETYSAGRVLVPTADGLSFADPQGKPIRFHVNSEMAKFANGVRAGGFDVSKLWDDKAQRPVFDALVGARFVMKGEDQHDRNGNVKKSKKGYTQQKFFPIQFKGYKEGIAKSNGPAPSADAVREKAAETILAILAEGPTGRAEMVRKVTAKLAGDPLANKVLALVTRDDFHKDQPWKRDASGFSL